MKYIVQKIFVRCPKIDGLVRSGQTWCLGIKLVVTINHGKNILCDELISRIRKELERGLSPLEVVKFDWYESEHHHI